MCTGNFLYVCEPSFRLNCLCHVCAMPYKKIDEALWITTKSLYDNRLKEEQHGAEEVRGYWNNIGVSFPDGANPV